MDKKKYWRLSNEMLGVTIIANFIGDQVTAILSSTLLGQQFYQIELLIRKITPFFLVGCYSLLIPSIIIYERPIRRALKRICAQSPVDPDLMLKSRQRLLNEPYMIILASLVAWFSGALVYGIAIRMSGQNPLIVRMIVLQSLLTGFITVTLAFFWLEHVLQARLTPVFFPQGGIYETPGVKRIRISTRLFALVMAASIIPLAAIHLTIHGSIRAMERGASEPKEILERLQEVVLVETVCFIFFAILLVLLIKVNLTKPIKEIIEVLQEISKGNFHRKVRVTSNDSIGYTGDIINNMTEGLKERDQLKLSLDLAMEIQQSLLPRDNLEMNGLQIAGKSIYCDETGGDYYDFLALEDESVGVAVGDVSGHGIPSALLMATVRSSLRQRSLLPGSIGTVISDVNRQLTLDVEGSGQFMTLFYLALYPGQQTMKWVRAGHEPGILYDAASDSFQELRGIGMALGVTDDFSFEENERVGFGQGQIVLLGTDGIWEARNNRGDMFGKAIMHDIVRNHAGLTAQGIVDQVFENLSEHCRGVNVEDDITLVVIKYKENGKP